MSTYGRFTPYTINSPLPDRSTNNLPVPASEDFDVGRNRYEPALPIPAYNDPGPNTYVPVYLSGWDDVVAARVRIRNTGTVLVYLIFVPTGMNGATPLFLSDQAISVVVPGGSTADIMARIGTPAGVIIDDMEWLGVPYDGQLAIQAESGPTPDGTTVEITVLEDLTVDTDIT